MLGQPGRHGREVREADRPSSRRRVGRRQRGDQGLGEHRGALDTFVQWTGGAANDGGIKPALCESPEAFLFGQADQLDVRMVLIVAQVFEHVTEKAAEAGPGCDPQPGAALAFLLRGLAGTFDGGDDLAGVFEKRSAGRGQFDRAGRAMEQLHAKLVLQPTDLLTDRRLNDVKFLRGTAKVPQLSDREKASNLPKLHLSPH